MYNQQQGRWPAAAAWHDWARGVRHCSTQSKYGTGQQVLFPLQLYCNAMCRRSSSPIDSLVRSPEHLGAGFGSNTSRPQNGSNHHTGGSAFEWCCYHLSLFGVVLASCVLLASWTGWRKCQEATGCASASRSGQDGPTAPAPCLKMGHVCAAQSAVLFERLPTFGNGWGHSLPPLPPLQHRACNLDAGEADGLQQKWAHLMLSCALRGPAQFTGVTLPLYAGSYGGTLQPGRNLAL